MYSRQRTGPTRTFNTEEARILLDTLPDDLSEEEPQSDAEDTLYVPECSQTSSKDVDLPVEEVSENESPPPQCTSQRDRIWKKKEKEDTSKIFEKREGPVVEEFQNLRTPVEFFLRFFDSSIEANIVQQTNLYINQQNKNVPTVSVNDLRGFLGVNLVMGYHTLPSYRDFWSSQPDLGVPAISSTMPRTRFDQILANIHLSDNTVQPPEPDKVFKIRPLISALNKNFVKLYDVKKIQSIDESMILFKGRSSIKQYCPMKPIKRGFKLWVRADTDGYISKFDVYQGKGTGCIKDFGLGENVVINLVEDLRAGHHQVYFDNYFTSIPLLEYLKENGVYGCGTIRSNRRGLPVGLIEDKKMARGDFDYRTSSDGIIFLKWMDNRSVLLASNFHSSSCSFVNRTQKDGSDAEIQCPVAVRDYNINMGGVDKSDMLAAAYGLNRKSKKWWHRLFFGLIDRTLVNAHIVYQSITATTMPLFPFTRDVALGLITMSRPPRVGRPLVSPYASPAPHSKKQRRGTYSVCDSIRLNNVGVHYVIFLKERGRCEVCAVSNIQSRPFSKCKLCNVFLCCNNKKNCFLAFHDLPN